MLKCNNTFAKVLCSAQGISEPLAGSYIWKKRITVDLQIKSTSILLYLYCKFLTKVLDYCEPHDSANNFAIVVSKFSLTPFSLSISLSLYYAFFLSIISLPFWDCKFLKWFLSRSTLCFCKFLYGSLSPYITPLSPLLKFLLPYIFRVFK